MLAAVCAAFALPPNLAFAQTDSTNDSTTNNTDKSTPAQDAKKATSTGASEKSSSVNKRQGDLPLNKIKTPADNLPVPKTSLPANTIPGTRANTQDLKAQTELLDVVDAANKSAGAIFVDPEKVQIKEPVLQALIVLDERLSPMQLDARSKTGTNLHDVLTTAMGNNLPIKITDSETMMRKWDYYGALSGFLPNLSNDINFEGLHGHYVSPAGLAIPIRNPYLTTSNTITQYLYKGGSILHGSLEKKHQYKASLQALKGTTNEVLFNATKLYYELVQNEVLLQIRIKAVDVAKALVQVQEDQYADGINTKLDVLQAKYELSAARQKLIEQQVARRESAVKLSAAINIDTGVDLDFTNRTLAKLRLVDNNMMAGDLLKIAVDNRPELKRYEELRVAAKEAIKVAKAGFLPVVMATGTIVGSGSRINPNTTLGSTSLSTSGASIGAIGAAGDLPLSGSATSGIKRWSMDSMFIGGIDMQYNLGGLGVADLAKVQTARYDARRIQLEGQKALQDVYKEVRDAYLSSMSAENLIKETTDAVNFAEEKLRVADTRMREGVGTYLDVINAQRDYTSALVAKADAIVKYNVSQAQILFAIGRLTVDTATSNNPLRQ